jgi:alpha-galactosidase
MIEPRRLSLLTALLALAALLAAAQPAPAAAKTLVTRSGSVITIANRQTSVRYDLDRGLADYRWGDRTVLRNAYSSAVLGDGTGATLYSFADAPRTASHELFQDAAGTGIVLRVATTPRNLDVTLLQQIFVYDEAPFITQRTSLLRRSPDGPPVSVSQIEVVAAGAASTPAGGITIDPAEDPRFYQAPFYNNDDFAVPPARDARGALSYWLGGPVDAARGHGLIAGAVETTRWKSAVWFDGPSGAISVHSGTVAPVDTVPPAPVRGQWVDSALMLLSFRDNHQWALADLMHVLRAFEPSLSAPALPPPIGWSAWYHYGLDTDAPIVHGVTDFIARHWAPLGYRYINLDAGWNRADGDTRYNPAQFPGGIEPVIRHIHQSGLLAGGYFVPFAISPGLLDEQVPGSDARFRDILVRDAAGQPIRASILDWEYVLDTTHPAALPFLYLSARRLVDYGFDFVKLDFLQIGAQEGVRHDPNVTAMEAFHRGMHTITRAWRDSGRPMFISAAISPLYIQPYVHARRVGNDVEFGQARQAANVGLSWFTGLLYHRNDPDNAVIRRTWFPGYNDGLARLHATMSALGGTLFLAGDDPRELAPARAALMTNPSVVALARHPVVIRPLSIKETPAPIWHAEQPDGTHLVAIFNWNGAAGRKETIRFRDLGLINNAVYTLYDLWSESTFGVFEFSFTVELPPHGVALLRITPRS